MTEVARRTNQQVVPHMSMNDKMQYAQALAQASLLPKQYQRNPGNVLLAVELGESLGIPPVQAINTVHVIEGKPSASSGLISALVRRAGHTLRVKGDDQSATAEIVRSDDPDFTYSVTWDMGRARNAGVTGRDNWKKYPAAMLKARAITEVARDACQEALMGVQYTPEELGAVVDEEGNVVDQPGPRGTQPRGGRFGLSGNFQQPAPAAPPAEQPTPAPDPEPEADGEPDAEDAPVMSNLAQWTAVNDLMESIGITEPADKGAEMQRWATEQGITRELGSMKALTADEADQFAGYLRQIASPEGAS